MAPAAEARPLRSGISSLLLVPPVRKLARDLGLVYLKGHDRVDSTPWAGFFKAHPGPPTVSLALTEEERGKVGGGPGSAYSPEAGSSSRAGAAADGRRRRPRGCGQAARRARADSLEMEEALPTRKSRGTTFGCPSIGTSAFSLGDGLRKDRSLRRVVHLRTSVFRSRDGRSTLLGDYLRAQGFELSDSTVRPNSAWRHTFAAALKEQKMWVTSHDDEFREKRDDVLRRLLRHTAGRAHHLRRREKPGCRPRDGAIRICPWSQDRAIRN